MSQSRATVAWSTPEAETYAAAFALRTIGIPNLDLWKTLNGGKDLVMEFREDIGTPDEKTADVETEKEKVLS